MAANFLKVYLVKKTLMNKMVSMKQVNKFQRQQTQATK